MLHIFFLLVVVLLPAVARGDPHPPASRNRNYLSLHSLHSPHHHPSTPTSSSSSSSSSTTTLTPTQLLAHKLAVALLELQTLRSPSTLSLSSSSSSSSPSSSSSSSSSNGGVEELFKSSDVDMCVSSCTFFTINDVPQCVDKCNATVPSPTHVVLQLPNNPINPYLRNDTLFCPMGYAPTPFISPPHTFDASFTSHHHHHLHSLDQPHRLRHRHHLHHHHHHHEHSALSYPQSSSRHHHHDRTQHSDAVDESGVGESRSQHRYHSRHDDDDRQQQQRRQAKHKKSVLQQSPHPPQRRPNIVMLLLDDQDEISSPYFSAMPFASSLFGERGTHFSHAFSTTSICCAARCQLLTGLLGHNVGVLTNGGPYGGFGAFSRPLSQFNEAADALHRLKDEQGRCIDNELRTFPLLLKRLGGYKTAIFGKYINGLEDDETHIIDHASPGWSHFAVGADHSFYTGYNYSMAIFDEDETQLDHGEIAAGEIEKVQPNITMMHFGSDDDDYSTDVLKRMAVGYIQKTRKQHRQRSQQQQQQQQEADTIESSSTAASSPPPLFLYLSPTAPHLPLSAAPRHRDHLDFWHDPAQFHRYVSSSPAYYEQYYPYFVTKPEWLLNSTSVPPDSSSSFSSSSSSSSSSSFASSSSFPRPYQSSNRDTLRNWNSLDFAKRMSSLYAVDDMLQEVHDTLDKLGELDNTIFILTSDNGYNLGAHHLIHKMAPYDPSIRIPLYFACGASSNSSLRSCPFPQAEQLDEYALLVDLAPTILELSGILPPSLHLHPPPPHDHGVADLFDGHSLLPYIPSPSHSQQHAPAQRQQNETPDQEKKWGEGDVLPRMDLLLQYGSYSMAELMPGIVQEFTSIQLAQLPLAFLDDVPAYLGLRSQSHLFIQWASTPGTNQTDPSPITFTEPHPPLLRHHHHHHHHHHQQHQPQAGLKCNERSCTRHEVGRFLDDMFALLESRQPPQPFSSETVVERYSGDHPPPPIPPPPPPFPPSTESHEYELYDLVADPYQLTNLLGVEVVSARDTMQALVMQARMYDLLQCRGRSCYMQL